MPFVLRFFLFLQDGRQDSGAGVDPELLEQAGSIPGGTQGAGGGDGQTHVRESRGEREEDVREIQRDSHKTETKIDREMKVEARGGMGCSEWSGAEKLTMERRKGDGGAGWLRRK